MSICLRRLQAADLCGCCNFKVSRVTCVTIGRSYNRRGCTKDRELASGVYHGAMYQCQPDYVYSASAGEFLERILDDWTNAVIPVQEAQEQTYLKPMAVRADPPHALYGSWEDVEACKREYIQKPPYEVTIGVKQVRVRLHHNPKARPHACL